MISVQNMTFTYSGAGQPAADGISFEVEPGEIFGFLGPSGAGKSTTQKILIGLLKGYKGRIEVLGKDLGAWGPDYYEKIGVSFELPNHYQKLTALENLDFFRSLYAGETEDPIELLEMVKLADDADTRVSRFSKGMQMRLTFARALLNRPELVFLDEPTSGLDPVNARRVKEAVLDLKREGRTVFLTTHNMTVADQLCDRVAFIVDGRVSLVAPPRELKVRHGERRVRVEYRDGGSIRHDEFPLDRLGDDERFLTLLRGEQIETIHTAEATLEDVFVETTGKTLA